MGLRFGWKAHEVWESHWPKDPSFGEIPEGALQEWSETGDASPLRPYVKHGTPTRITYRTLTLDETQFVRGVCTPDAWMTEQQALNRAVALCFRIGVDFPDEKPTYTDAGGAVKQKTVKEKGIRMLADEYSRALDAAYPGIVKFYGSLIFNAAFATEAEKKASSLQSTPSQSAPTTASEETVA